MITRLIEDPLQILAMRSHALGEVLAAAEPKEIDRLLVEVSKTCFQPVNAVVSKVLKVISAEAIDTAAFRTFRDALVAVLASAGPQISQKPIKALLTNPPLLEEYVHFFQDTMEGDVFWKFVFATLRNAYKYQKPLAVSWLINHILLRDTVGTLGVPLFSTVCVGGADDKVMKMILGRHRTKKMKPRLILMGCASIAVRECIKDGNRWSDYLSLAKIYGFDPFNSVCDSGEALFPFFLKVGHYERFWRYLTVEQKLKALEIWKRKLEREPWHGTLGDRRQVYLFLQKRVDETPTAKRIYRTDRFVYLKKPSHGAVYPSSSIDPNQNYLRE